jgi:hypothetical protein
VQKHHRLSFRFLLLLVRVWKKNHSLKRKIYLFYFTKYLLQLITIVELGNGSNRVSECRLKGFLTFIKCPLWYLTKFRIHRLKSDTGGSEICNCNLQY